MKLYCTQSLPLASAPGPVFLNGALAAFDPAQASRMLARQLDQAAFAQDCGFDGLVLHERHAAADSGMVSAALVAAALAQRAPRLRMLLHALPLPMKDPHLWAEELAWLDLATAGRIEASFAVGDGPAWWAAPGWPAHARARFSEALTLLERARTEALPLRHEGEFFSYKFYAPALRPLQAPMPLALAGADVFTQAEARRLGWPCLALDAPLPVQASLCRGAAPTEQPAQPSWLGAYIHIGSGSGVQAANESLARLQASRHAVAPQWTSPPGLLAPEEYAALLGSTQPAPMPAFVGSADEVAADLARWAGEASASHLALAFDWPGLADGLGEAAMRRFADSVAPRLAA